MPPCVLTASLLLDCKSGPRGISRTSFQEHFETAGHDGSSRSSQLISYGLSAMSAGVLGTKGMIFCSQIPWIWDSVRGQVSLDELLNVEWDESTHRHQLLLWCEQVFVSKLHVNSKILHFCALVTSGNLFYWRQSSIFLKIKSTLKICLTRSSKKKRDSIPFLSNFLIFYWCSWTQRKTENQRPLNIIVDLCHYVDQMGNLFYNCFSDSTISS